MEYRQILDWVNKEDWSALLDVVPFMFLPLGIYVVVMLLSNALGSISSARLIRGTLMVCGPQPNVSSRCFACIRMPTKSYL